MKKIKLLIRYIKDKEVSIFKKLLIFGGLFYLIFPMDIVPDFIIGLGILDDAAVLLFVWNAIKSELSEYEEKVIKTGVDPSRVIEVDFKKEDDD
ncbi:hypothetical protein SDC9_98583 [bioreactor metagenome]|uniref:DUF1232 domain-containing protein n=2 Tax=root TaxID=1 RepID=A0ABT1NFC7_9FIRM|nr:MULTISPECIES: DUF1232 domain-containing protein [Lutispora]MCQ1528873.1 DUF1232 domain-containing protein [Lutispora saccharofermentans]MEA4961432.1 DUF1232 domain-containing protein [Lutispora sp.]